MPRGSTPRGVPPGVNWPPALTGGSIAALDRDVQTSPDHFSFQALLVSDPRVTIKMTYPASAAIIMRAERKAAATDAFPTVYELSYRRIGAASPN